MLNLDFHPQVRTIISKTWNNKNDHLCCYLFSSIGAIGHSSDELNIVDHPLELMEYQCQGMEPSLQSCPANVLSFCQLVATIQCQGI